MTKIINLFSGRNGIAALFAGVVIASAASPALADHRRDRSCERRDQRSCEREVRRDRGDRAGWGNDHGWNDRGRDRRSSWGYSRSRYYSRGSCGGGWWVGSRGCSGVSVRVSFPGVIIIGGSRGCR